MFLQLSLASGVFACFILFITYSPGTYEFFLHQVIGWGTYSFSFARLGYRNWVHLETLRDLKWDEKVGEWGFRVSFWCQLIWSVPLLVLMIVKCYGKGILMFTLSAVELERSGEGTFWEHLIFASLFAFMLRDCFLFYDTVDILFALHHIAVMSLMFCLYFINTIAGTTALAICCVVGEIGTCAYCAYIIWNYKSLYKIVMTASNITFFILISGAYYMQESTKEGWWLLLSLYLIGVFLVIGRQAVLYHEINYRKYELSEYYTRKTGKKTI